MQYAELIEIINKIEPEKHIISGRRGSEENLKIKLILPILEFLGYDILTDMDFERMSTDIVLLDKANNPLLIVETKAWEQNIYRYLNQCLEYTLKLKTPLILITSGKQTAIYSSLLNIDDLNNTKPIFEFSFNDLQSNSAKDILNQLYGLISKNSLTTGGLLINTKITELIGGEQELIESKREFLNKCKNFKSSLKTIKISEEEYDKIIDTYDEGIKEAFLYGKNEFKKIVKEYPYINYKHGTKEIGLEYFDGSGPRAKKIGLVGLYPNRKVIAFGLEGWEKLLKSKILLDEIKKFPRNVKNKKQIENLAKLVRKGLNSFKK